MSSSKSYKISGCGSSNPDSKVGAKMCVSCAMNVRGMMKIMMLNMMTLMRMWMMMTMMMAMLRC